MVKNLVYNLEIIAEIFIADSFIKRFLGFMFREKPHHEAILIKPCNSIHTFFMKFPIDVLFIDEDMEVLRKIDGLKMAYKDRQYYSSFYQRNYKLVSSDCQADFLINFRGPRAFLRKDWDKTI